MDKTSIKTLQDLVKNAAESYGEGIFVREKDGKDIAETSFARFFENCGRVAAYLNEVLGGEKVHASIIGLTCSQYLTAYFGTVLNGNITVPLDAQLAPADIIDLVDRADVNVFFFDKRYEPMLPAIKASCSKIKAFVSLQPCESADTCISDILEKYAPAGLIPYSENELASIVYTSGTTGKSKGVMLTHANFIDNTMCQDNESSPEESLLSVLPIHHCYCFSCDILLSLRYGTTVCVNDSMMRIAQNLKLFQPSFILLVPMIAETIYKQIMAASKAKQLPPKVIAQAFFGGRLKGIYSGGAYLAPELVSGYLEMGIPIAQGYGMTECSPRISTAMFNDISTAGDVGRIVNGCTVRIVDGEITVKSGSVMKGYYNMPAETAEAIDAEGWLHTGDLGYVDETTNRLFITGRKKNLIILSNGENVSPEELENKFAMIDIIKELLIYAEDGVITAEILPNTDICPDINEAVKQLHDIIDEVNKTLPSAKTIHRLRVRDTEFDKTTSKKIKRNQTTRGEVK
ncbi:MAG: AMP-binding protein [Oscillospiraceae bacterium]|nr:AMP-binding protein [Oscillospiraceae bacterium]